MGQRERRAGRRGRCAVLWLCVLSLSLTACRSRSTQSGPSPLVDVYEAPANSADSRAPSKTSLVSFEAVPIDEPLRLRNRRDLESWDLPLQEAIFIALSRAEVIRQNGQFFSPTNTLLRSPDGLPTVYDPALQESGVLFGQRGVEAALSDFDTQFTTRTVWGNSQQIQNNPFIAGGLPAGATLDEDSGQFRASLDKTFATGGRIGVSHNWNYSANNSLGRLLPSVYEGDLRAEFRQPLLAGGGTEFTRIAGPISDNIQGVTGVQQGVLIAQISGDITVADFESNVASFLRDVERQYWQLHLAYRTVESELAGLRTAREIYEVVQGRVGAQAPGGGAGRLVEAREGVLQSEKRSLQALDGLYAAEAQLRLLMGLSVNDGCFIRPSDTPVTAEIALDWDCSLGEALARRPELRRQKLVVGSEELQLIAAENLLRPRLDFVASQQLNGFGDNLFGPGEAPGTTRALGSAYGRLFGLEETSWSAGFEYSQVIGRRYAITQMRNHELRLAKAQAILRTQETEISHELAAAFREVDRTWLSLRSETALLDNAQLRVEVARQEYLANRDGTAFLSLEALNRAVETLARAESDMAKAEVDYTLSLTEIEYRCGRLLQFNNVNLQEDLRATCPSP